MARVLVIDGETDSRAAIAAALRDEHFVLEVKDARNGLFCLAAERWDVLVLDLDVPGSRDRPVLEHMSELRMPRPEVVLLTPEVNATANLPIPIHATLCRPVDLSELRQAVANAAQVRQLRGAQLLGSDAAESQQEALLARAQQLAEISGSVPGVLFRLLVTEQGARLFTFVSSGCADLFEISEEALLTDADRLDELIHPEDRERFSTLWHWSARANIRYRFEGRLLLMSGRVRWIQCLAQPKEVMHRAVAWDGVITDISDRMVAQANALLADRLTVVRTMAESTWQEVSRPLLAIRDALEELRSQAPERSISHAQVSIHQALQGVQRLESWLADLSTFAHNPGLRARPIEVRRVLEACLRLLRSEIGQRAQLVCDCDEAAWVVVDEATLAQVFFDLLLVSARTISKGHPSSHTIRVSLRASGASVRVEIADSSPHVPRGVFERSLSHPTSSLSLYACDILLDDWGGKLEARPRRGHGNFLIVHLPRAAAPAALQEQEGVSQGPAPQVAHLRLASERPPRVLLVDPQLPTREALGELLEGYDVMVARSVREAVGKIEQTGPFDLVLCELELPDATGADVYAAARRIHPGSEQRVVFMAEAAGSAGVAQAPCAVAARVRVHKPLTRRHVSALLRRLRR